MLLMEELPLIPYSREMVQALVCVDSRQHSLMYN